MQKPWVRHPIFPAVIVLVLLVVAVFFPVLDFEFVILDVHEQVVYNPCIRGLTVENIKHILTMPCITSYYPLRTLTFAIDYQIWGLDPKGFKLTNMLIHLTNVIMVFGLVLRLIRDGGLSCGSSEAWDVSVATVSSGIFAVHPVVVEPVTWVAGREELLMTLGALGCFHLHLTARQLQLEKAAHRNRAALFCHAGAAVACAAACLSNAVAAVIPLLITTWDALMLKRPKLGRIIWGTSALWGIGLVTFIIKKLAKVPSHDAVPQMFSREWLLSVFSVPWLNLKALVWPTDLCFHYGWPRPQGFFDLEVVLGGTTLGLVCLVLWVLRRRKRTLFGLLWFVLALVPASHIFFVHHFSRADRFLYLPLVGLALALGAGLRPVKNVLAGYVLRALVGMGTLIVLLLTTISVGQIQTWRNSVAVYTHALGVSETGFAHNCLGTAFLDQGHLPEAIYHLRRTLSINTKNAEAHHNLGSALLMQGQLPEAIHHYRRALDINPDDGDTHHSLGLALFRLRQLPEAIHHYRRAISIEPSYVHAYHDLGNALVEQGRISEAIHHYRQAVRIEPSLWQAHVRLGALFLDQDKRHLAVKHLREALKLRPDSVEARELLRNALEE